MQTCQDRSSENQKMWKKGSCTKLHIPQGLQHSTDRAVGVCILPNVETYTHELDWRTVCIPGNGILLLKRRCVQIGPVVRIPKSAKSAHNFNTTNGLKLHHFTYKFLRLLGDFEPPTRTR